MTDCLARRWFLEEKNRQVDAAEPKPQMWMSCPVAGGPRRYGRTVGCDADARAKRRVIRIKILKGGGRDCEQNTEEEAGWMQKRSRVSSTLVVAFWRESFGWIGSPVLRRLQSNDDHGRGERLT